MTSIIHQTRAVRKAESAAILKAAITLVGRASSKGKATKSCKPTNIIAPQQKSSGKGAVRRADLSTAVPTRVSARLREKREKREASEGLMRTIAEKLGEVEESDSTRSRPCKELRAAEKIAVAELVVDVAEIAPVDTRTEGEETKVSAELSIQELVSIDASKIEDYEDLLRDLDSDFEVLMMSAEDWEGVGCVSTSPITFFEPQACSTPVRTDARTIPVETYERLMDRDLAFEALMKATIDDDDDDETELQIPCTIRINIPTILLNGEPLLQDDAFDFEPQYCKPKTAFTNIPTILLNGEPLLQEDAVDFEPLINIPTILLNGEPLQDDEFEPQYFKPETVRTNIPTILLNGEPLLQDDAFEPEYLKPKTARSTKCRSSHKRRRRSLSLTDLIKSHKVTEDELIADFSLDAEYRQAMEAVGW